MKLQLFYFISVNLNWFKQKSKLMQRIVQKIYLLNVCLLLELFVKNHPYFFPGTNLNDFSFSSALCSFSALFP